MTMEFLVHMRIDLDGQVDPDRAAELRRQEAARADVLARSGTLVRLWRVPGARENWGLWRAGHATELHEAIASLPLWPWITAEVHPLARHDNDPVPPSNTPG